jgi:hypothetical protein
VTRRSLAQLAISSMISRASSTFPPFSSAAAAISWRAAPLLPHKGHTDCDLQRPVIFPSLEQDLGKRHSKASAFCLKAGIAFSGIYPPLKIRRARATAARRSYALHSTSNSLIFSFRNCFQSRNKICFHYILPSTF